MGCKKRAVASLAVASLLVVGTGFATFALADTTTGNQTPQSETEQSSLAKVSFGSLLPAEKVTCNEVQGKIDAVEQGGAFQITDACTADLVIPSGKTIYLTLHSEAAPTDTTEETTEQVSADTTTQAYSESVDTPDDDTDEITDPDPEEPKPTHASLTNKDGDTITVQEGAVLYYEGSGDTNEYLANNSKDNSIINNHGTVYILSGTFKAENEARTLINDGEINLLGGNYTGTSFQNNDGKVRVVAGTFDDAEGLQSYIINGSTLDSDTKTVAPALSNDEKNPLKVYNDKLSSLNNKKFPVGYTFSIKSEEYSDYADAFDAFFASSDQSIIEVTGSNAEGWTFTVAGAGQAELTYAAIYQASKVNVDGYEIAIDVPGTEYDFTEYLLENAAVKQAIVDGQTISVKLESTPLTEASTDDSQEIAKVVGEDDKVAYYYNIELTVYGNKDDSKTELVKITDLGDQTIEIRLSIAGLEAVAEGYTRPFYVVRIHDGQAEKIDDVELDGEELVFQSGKFSTYAIVYADTQNTTPPATGDDKEPSTDGNNTGDNSDTTTPGDNTGDNTGDGSGTTTTPGDNAGNNTSDGNNNSGNSSSSDNNGNSSNNSGSSNTSNSSSNNSNSNNSNTNNSGSSSSNSNNSSNNSNNSNSNSNNSSNSSSNKPNNSGIGVPNSGVISYYLENDEARIALIIMLVAASVISSLITAAIVSRKHRR